MTTLPNMNIELPTLGADNGAWDDKLNAGLSLVDAHDHTSGKGVRVPTAGININADLAFGGFGPTGLGKAAFNAVAALAAGSKTLFVSSADNELYWRTNGGTNVKLTSGTTLNVTLVGGIVGDYSSVGAEVAYDDANDRYTFKQQGSPKPWARLASGPVRIYEYNTTESVYVELAVASALAASYTLTLPAALPGSTVLCQVSSAGVVSFSNTVASAITATTFKNTVAVIRTIPAAGAIAQNAAFTFAGTAFNFGAAASSIVYPLPVNEGERITSYSIRLNKASDNTNTLTVTLEKQVDGTATTIDTQSNATNAPGLITLSATGLTQDVAAGDAYVIRVAQSDSSPSATDSTRNATVGVIVP